MQSSKSPSEKRWNLLKEKLASLGRDEINTVASFGLLQNLFFSSIKPLYEYIMEELRQFNIEFLVSNFEWHAGNTPIKTIVELENNWRDENFLKQNRTIHFWYRLSGLKKAGAEGHEIVVSLLLDLDVYYYGFKVSNYNHDQLFVKKLYHQELSKQNVENIVEVLCMQIMDRIEQQINL